MKRALIAIVVIALIGGGIYGLTRRQTATTSHQAQLQVIAGENFWGSLVSQLGGTRIAVTSIVSDPNADPHEYETNAATARAFTTANYVVLNGAGYDTWGDKMLSSSANPSRKVLKVADLLGKKEGDNPHFWYNSTYVNTVVGQMEKDLIALDPAGIAYYQRQAAALRASLSAYQTTIANIKHEYPGAPVAATEDIFAYFASAAGLDLLSPPAFTSAVAEGNDPPVASVTEFQQQLTNGQAKILVYNEQTITPLTENMKKLATDHHIPIVGITETVQPPTATFQDWMTTETMAIIAALHSTSK